MTDDVTNLSADELAKQIARFEAERQRRAGPTEPAPLVVERVIVPDLVVPPPPPPKAEPRPRKKKLRKEIPSTPTYIWITTIKPSATDCGSIEEGWFVIADGQVFLCDSAGLVNGEGRAIARDDPTWTARQMLRERRLPRPGEPFRGRINYPPTGWR